MDGREPESADPYLIACYMNQTTDKWILEVRRERSIELLLEGFRYDDLMRWKLGSMLTRIWRGIYIPQKGVAQDLNGDGVNDVCVVDSNPGTEPGVRYIDLSLSTNRYSLDENNCLVYNETRLWDDRKYLHPIPKTARVVNPNLEQNPKWDE